MAFYYNTHIFHLRTSPRLRSPLDPTPTSNHLQLFRGLEPIVLDSLRELMLHVDSSLLLSSTFTPKKYNFASLLKTISLARNLEVLHLNSCGHYANALSDLIEHCTPINIFPKLLLLVIHTDRRMYAECLGKKTYACKDLEWWKHESQSLAGCRECGKQHLVEVTWRVIAKRSRSGYGSEEKQRLIKGRKRSTKYACWRR